MSTPSRGEAHCAHGGHRCGVVEESAGEPAPSFHVVQEHLYLSRGETDGWILVPRYGQVHQLHPVRNAAEQRPSYIGADTQVLVFLIYHALNESVRLIN